MKLDRRSFLGLGLGAVAGAAVSPVGAKLTDDLAIWTQNWPWTPVPSDGKVTFDNSACSLCPGNCGISVRKISGRPVKIEGREGYPINDGGICLHGISALQYLYDPARIKAPLKKSGEKFEEISWKEAVGLVTEALSSVREKSKSETVACIAGSDQGTLPALFKRFLKVFGSNHFYSMPSMETTWAVTASKMHGSKASLGFDLAHSDFVLSFGAGILDGWGSPVYNFRANAERTELGGKLYQIEPRLSNTAASADMWIPAAPGSEGDLALGICSVIIQEELYDSLYALYFDSNFQQFSKLVTSKYTPEKVAEKTGLAAEKIRKIATEFIKAKRPVAIAGKGRGDRAGDLREFAAVHALNCLAGNINKKGGVWVNKTENYYKFPAVILDSTAKKGLSKKASPSIEKFISSVHSSSQSFIDVLFIYDANPCYTLHDSTKITEAVKKIPLTVSFASYMDETAQQADIILPSHMFLEDVEDLPPAGSMAEQVVGISEQVVKPIFDTKNPGDALLSIAKSLKGSMADNFPWKNYEKCLKSVIGNFWDKLSDEGYVVLKKKPTLEKPNVNFSLAAADVSPVTAPGDSNEYPLILISVDKMRLAANETASSPFAVKTVPDDVLKKKDMFVEINPETADKLKLDEGDRITVTTAVGAATVRVHRFEGIMPGVIGMAEGLGHSLTGNRYISGKGANVNTLIGPVFDSGSGLDAAWGIRAKVSKA